MSDQNLRYLQIEYFERTPAANAYGNFQKWSDHRLCKVLRHHDEQDISEAETWYRDQFDYLLGFYGIVEIGAMIGFVNEFPSTFRGEHLPVLSHPAVRRYYEWNYPLELPGRLCERLNEVSARRSKVYPQTLEKFFAFLEMTRIIERDEDVESFLWTLDGGWREDEGGECNIDRLLRALQRPEKFIRALQVPQKKRTELESALNGFYKFIQFCEAFRRLLLQQGFEQQVAEAMWHYHAYWFRQFETEIGDNFRSALRELEKWKVKGLKGIDAGRVPSARDRVREIDEAIKDLSIPPFPEWKAEKRKIRLGKKRTADMPPKIEIGRTYQGRVTSTKEFGAFVEIFPGQDGLIHVSELADFRVKRTEDVVQVGDTVPVKCISIDDKGRIKFSRKAALKKRTEVQFSKALSTVKT